MVLLLAAWFVVMAWRNMCAKREPFAQLTEARRNWHGYIFVLPGMGKYLIDAITWRDYPAIQGVNLFICSLIIIINLTVDLLYGVLDPRIRYR